MQLNYGGNRKVVCHLIDRDSNGAFLSPSVLMHGGLLCTTFHLSVCLSLDQNRLDNNSYRNLPIRGALHNRSAPHS